MAPIYMLKLHSGWCNMYISTYGYRMEPLYILIHIMVMRLYMHQKLTCIYSTNQGFFLTSQLKILLCNCYCILYNHVYIYMYPNWCYPLSFSPCCLDEYDVTHQFSPIYFKKILLIFSLHVLLFSQKIGATCIWRWQWVSDYWGLVKGVLCSK